MQSQPQQPPYPPAGGVGFNSNAGGGYPPPGSTPGYPPAGSAPGYPPAGSAPTSGGYPAGAAPPSGGHPSAPPAGAEGDAVEPSAPPLEKMDAIPGYDIGFLSGGDLQPPSYDEAIRGSGPPDRRTNTNLPTLNEEEAKEALREHVAQHCCYGKKPAAEVQVQGLGESMAFHYSFSSFTETRSTAWTQEPYTGQIIDGPQNGPAPGPWDIAVYPKQKFKESKTTMEVPHTASVKPCYKCIGLCRVRCHHCHGMGRNTCMSCSGSGNRTVFRDGDHRTERCSFCHGDGRSQCSWCHGHGQIKCRTCNGRGQLKCYIKLTVQWKSHHDDSVLERTAVPPKLITKAQGIVVFDEEQPLVWPLTNFPEAQINQVSRQLVDKHRTTWPREKIILQHHSVKVVPVTQVSYKWQDHTGTYYIYGNEHNVYAPDYPQRCCCGCTIL